MIHRTKAIRSNGFSSKLESAVHGILKLRELQGEISDIKCQQTVVLVPGPREMRIQWKIDFSFIEAKTGGLVYCEAKGIEDREYKLKLKLYRSNPPAPLEIWRGHYSRPTLVERIEV